MDGDIIRTVPLPGSRFDILLQVEVASVAAGRDLKRALNAVLPDGDGLKLNTAAGVTGVHIETGLAEIREDGQEEAVSTVCAAFGTQDMALLRRERSPGGDAPLLVFAPTGVDPD